MALKRPIAPCDAKALREYFEKRFSRYSRTLAEELIAYGDQVFESDRWYLKILAGILIFPLGLFFLVYNKLTFGRFL
ncbi:MAG TPA: hypothetical protein VG941_01105 [Candidatus Paceibacterota bacterium]|nr:hypothetical protein [Candidatus Paceibacterota bacterium]